MIPESGQKVILRELNTILYYTTLAWKSLTHVQIWLPLIDKHIEQLVREWESCQEVCVTIHPLPSCICVIGLMDHRKSTWMFHVDFARSFQWCAHDHHFNGENTGSAMYHIHKIRASGTTDMPQFTSVQFEIFMKRSCIHHI